MMKKIKIELGYRSPWTFSIEQYVVNELDGSDQENGELEAMSKSICKISRLLGKCIAKLVKHDLIEAEELRELLDGYGVATYVEDDDDKDN